MCRAQISRRNCLCASRTCIQWCGRWPDRWTGLERCFGTEQMLGWDTQTKWTKWIENKCGPSAIQYCMRERTVALCVCVFAVCSVLRLMPFSCHIKWNDAVNGHNYRYSSQKDVHRVAKKNGAASSFAIAITLSCGCGIILNFKWAPKCFSRIFSAIWCGAIVAS